MASFPVRPRWLCARSSLRRSTTWCTRIAPPSAATGKCSKRCARGRCLISTCGWGKEPAPRSASAWWNPPCICIAKWRRSPAPACPVATGLTPVLRKPARLLLKRSHQRPALAQDGKPRDFDRVLRIVVRDPFFLFGRPGSFHLRHGHLPFVVTGKIERKLFARQIEIGSRELLRRFRLANLAVGMLKFRGDAAARAIDLRPDLLHVDFRLRNRGLRGAAHKDGKREGGSKFEVVAFERLEVLVVIVVSAEQRVLRNQVHLRKPLGLVAFDLESFGLKIGLQLADFPAALHRLLDRALFGGDLIRYAALFGGRMHTVARIEAEYLRQRSFRIGDGIRQHGL